MKSKRSTRCAMCEKLIPIDRLNSPNWNVRSTCSDKCKLDFELSVNRPKEAESPK